MHLIGARFATMETAMAALREIRGTLPIEPVDVGLRPLGTTRYDEPVDDLVVAGRFEAADVERVVAILEGHGGSILVRRPETRRPGWPHSATKPVVVPATRAERAGDARPATRGGERPRAAGGPARKRPRRPATHLRVRTARERRIRQ